jgi:hypothetical protein
MLVIGNGESRKDIDIDKIEGPKVGCNAIYRDYEMDYLVCIDKRMIQEAVNAGANQNSLVYTRPEYKKRFDVKRIRAVPRLPYVGSDSWDIPKHWGSGPYAVLIGSTYTKLKEVKLLGFDLYSKDGKTNNIYKDTPNYNVSDKTAVDPRYWIHQIGKVFECFPNVRFIIYQEDNWQLPKAWKYPNVKVDNISNIYYNT